MVVDSSNNCITPKELRALLILNRFYSGKKTWDMLTAGQSAVEVFDFLGQTNKHSQREVFDVERELEECLKRNVRILTFHDADYPKLLREISDPPFVLYLMGNLHASDHLALSIVGSRYPSTYGVSQTRKFSGYLSEQGLTVVSGLAKGIDQVAHQAALEIPYGRTLAVVGCGLDQDYPRGSQKLKERIMERGAILSEYAFGVPPRAENFPKRNRIISGLSFGTLVMQAHEKSGSLITAHQALEQGRDVFSMPGPVDDYVSKGTHRLIKEGAMLVEHPEEVLEELAPMLKQNVCNETGNQVPLPKPAEAVKRAKHSPQEMVLIEYLRETPATYETINQRMSEIGAPLASLLLKLELSRSIEKRLDGRYYAVVQAGGQGSP